MVWALNQSKGNNFTRAMSLKEWKIQIPLPQAVSAELRRDIPLRDSSVSIYADRRHVKSSRQGISQEVGLPEIRALYKGQKLNTKFYFLKFSGSSGKSRQKNPGYPTKICVFPGFEGRTEPFGPQSFTLKPPKRIWTKARACKRTCKVLHRVTCNLFVRGKAQHWSTLPIMDVLFGPSGADMTDIN